jgi:hypothetical protein
MPMVPKQSFSRAFDRPVVRVLVSLAFPSFFYPPLPPTLEQGSEQRARRVDRRPKVLDRESPREIPRTRARLSIRQGDLTPAVTPPSPLPHPPPSSPATGIEVHARTLGRERRFERKKGDRGVARGQRAGGRKFGGGRREESRLVALWRDKNQIPCIIHIARNEDDTYCCTYGNQYARSRIAFAVCRR